MSVEVANLEIKLVLGDEGEMFHYVTSRDGNGDELPVIQALGMLELAKDTVLCAARGEEMDEELDYEEEDGD